MEEKNPIQVSERIFNTIEYLAQYGPMGLLELSKGLNLNKTTVHRILNSLICMNYVKQDPETLKYSLSFKFCGIANQVLSQNNIIDLAHPYIKSLAEQTGETVHLVEIDGMNAVYIESGSFPECCTPCFYDWENNPSFLFRSWQSIAGRYVRRENKEYLGTK